jgi:hypothetical protein
MVGAVHRSLCATLSNMTDQVTIRYCRSSAVEDTLKGRSIVNFLHYRVEARSSKLRQAVTAFLGPVCSDAVVADNLVAARAVPWLDRDLGAVSTYHHPGEKTVWASIEGAELRLKLLKRRVD